MTSHAPREASETNANPADAPTARDWITDLAARINAGLAPEWCDEMRQHMDAYRVEVLREAEEYVRQCAAGWQAVVTPDRPDHFKVIAAHALLIADGLRRKVAETEAARG